MGTDEVQVELVITVVEVRTQIIIIGNGVIHPPDYGLVCITYLHDHIAIVIAGGIICGTFEVAYLGNGLAVIFPVIHRNLADYAVMRPLEVDRDGLLHMVNGIVADREGDSIFPDGIVHGKETEQAQCQDQCDKEKFLHKLR